uniref:Uncharacterized protein n=1 Tax=Chloropicon laureae TaxID=464258 RepID=A0A7S2YUF3_9CHLO|mmetsp:Transcript_10307/g.26436  ORF Transcript_10307/g.26436 Transcript_10307/m.26436 type:complete len:157 (+) Transcript_10307:267-737(+)
MMTRMLRRGSSATAAVFLLLVFSLLLAVAAGSEQEGAPEPHLAEAPCSEAVDDEGEGEGARQHQPCVAAAVQGYLAKSILTDALKEHARLHVQQKEYEAVVSSLALSATEQERVEATILGLIASVRKLFQRANDAPEHKAPEFRKRTPVVAEGERR